MPKLRTKPQVRKKNPAWEKYRKVFGTHRFMVSASLTTDLGASWGASRALAADLGRQQFNSGATEHSTPVRLGALTGH